MADDKKTIGPDVGTPTEAPEQPSPAPNLSDTTSPAPLGPEELTVEEQLILEHEGQAVLFEMGEAVPDPADAVTHAEVEEPAAPEAPKAEMEQAQPPDPGKDAPAPAHSGKVVDFSAALDEAAKEEKKAVKQKSRPRKRPRPPSPAEVARPRMARPLPVRPSRPNLGTKSPKASPSRRSLPWIRAALPLVRRSRRSRLRPETPPVSKKRRSFISTCLICTRSKIIPLVSGMMRRCRDSWSRSRRQASISPRWCVPVRMAAMRLSQVTAASGQASLPDLRICRISSAT